MKPSTKAELALDGMVELAKLKPAKPLALSVLAEKQSISLSYLEQVFAALRRNGLVLSVRGPGGGYLLSRPADQITAGDVIQAVDQKAPEAANADDSPETQLSPVAANVQVFWTTMHQRVLDQFHLVTVADIVEGNIDVSATGHKMTPQAAE